MTPGNVESFELSEVVCPPIKCTTNWVPISKRKEKSMDQTCWVWKCPPPILAFPLQWGPSLWSTGMHGGQQRISNKYLVIADEASFRGWVSFWACVSSCDFCKSCQLYGQFPSWKVLLFFFKWNETYQNFIMSKLQETCIPNKHQNYIARVSHHRSLDFRVTQSLSMFAGLFLLGVPDIWYYYVALAGLELFT